MPKKFDDCVAQVKAQGNADNVYAVCHAALGESAQQEGAITVDEAKRVNEALEAAGITARIEATTAGTNGAALRKESAKPKSTKLREAAAGEVGALTGDDLDVTIISEGPGNLGDRHWYTKQAIESGVLVFEGAKAFLNHPSGTEMFDRPERVIEDVIGFYHGLRTEMGEDGRAKLRGKLKLTGSESDKMRHLRGLLREAGPYAKQYPGRVLFGISINANGEDQEGEIQGEPWNVVTRFVEAFSADVVTFPAAGGEFRGQLEALRDAAKRANSKEAVAMKKVLNAATKAAEDLMAAKDDEGKLTASTNLKAALMAMDLVMPDDEKPADNVEHPDAGNQQQSEADKAKADEEAKKKAESEASEKTEAALVAKKQNLLEAAKLVAKDKPELAKSLEGDAAAIDEKLVDFKALRERAKVAETELALRRSGETARKLLAESGLPASQQAAMAERLVGLTETQQRAEIADRKALIESIAADLAPVRSAVEGAGFRVSPEATKASESVLASARESGLPMKAIETK
jgi:hypothetical protein